MVGPSVGAAVDAFLATLQCRHRSQLCGDATGLGDPAGGQRHASRGPGLPAGGAEVCAWFERRWGERAAATRNRNLDALRSASRHWADQGWIEQVLTEYVGHYNEQHRSLGQRSPRQGTEPTQCAPLTLPAFDAGTGLEVSSTSTNWLLERVDRSYRHPQGH